MSYALPLLRAAFLHVAGVAVWFAFCLSQPAFSAPSDVLNGVCTSGQYAHGEAWDGACTGFHSLTYTVAELESGWNVIGVDWIWYRVDSMTGSEVIAINDSGSSLWSEIGYEGGGDPDPDPDPEPTGEFGLQDLDMEEVLRAFSSGFFLVALFWGFGKGIALILQQVRRG